MNSRSLVERFPSPPIRHHAPPIIMPRKVLVSKSLGAEAYLGTLPGTPVADEAERSVRRAASALRESVVTSSRTFTDAVRLLFSR